MEDVGADSKGNVIIVGGFEGSVDFDPNPGSYNLTSNGNYISGFLLKLDSTGSLNWAKSIRAASDFSISRVVVDKNDDIIIGGQFQGSVDFDPDSVSTFNLISTNWNTFDVFIAKYDRNGNFIWAKQFGGVQHDRFESMEVDKNGNIFSTGWFYGVSDFDPGMGTFNLTQTGTFQDVYFSKLDVNGNFVWAKQLQSLGVASKIAMDLAVDSNSNMFAIGSFHGTVDFDPGVQTKYLYSNQTDHTFVLKLDSNGSYSWVKQLGSSQIKPCNGESITTDNLGNVYATGSFEGTVDFDPDSTATVNITANGFKDIFIECLDQNGNYVWAKKIGNTGQDRGFSVKIDVSNNLYVCGDYDNTVDFNPGAGIFQLPTIGTFSYFYLKLDLNGSFIHADGIEGTISNRKNRIALDRFGNLFSTGVFRGIVDFNPDSIAQHNLSSLGDDNFILKLNLVGLSTGYSIQDKEETVWIYPNPNNGHFMIKADRTWLGSNMELFDTKGAIISQMELTDLNTRFDIPDIPEGVYIIRLWNPKNNRTKMIQVSK